MDPLSGSTWSSPAVVAGFVKSPPNAALLAFAEHEIARAQGRHALDIGCGAGRNAVPLAQLGWRVLGTDLSQPMLAAARARIEDEPSARFQPVLAPMDRLPAANRSVDFVVAHGIWNLARSGPEFRSALEEAARVARDGAALFVFTFSRRTLPADARPIAGETFVFTDFSGEPQCFLDEPQLVGELARVGFAPDRAIALRELNVPRPGQLPTGRVPIIFEGVFRRSKPVGQ
ncbi:MAG TPA: class I SAM-dependent methyltransferase [Vicinamibacterales bacterium]|nr:class I SAM-dependent methyltransferase [Vicinamibacterales bacterium]